MSIRSTARWSARLALVVGTLGFWLFWSSAAQAYPWMIRHGYTGCNACHADPSGGGLLTPYGRAQGELLLRTRYPSEPKSDDAGPNAGFLFSSVPLPDSLLLGGEIRAAEFHEATPGSPATNQWIWMQADLEGQYSFADRFRINASVGYVPQGDLPDAISRAPKDNVISRVHWIGVDLGTDKEWTVRAGRMDLPFGIRSVEHTYWVRTATGTDVDSTQEDGASVSYNANSLRGEAMIIAGNYQVSPDAYRQRGYSAYFEWAPNERTGVGVTSIATHAGRDVLLQTPAWRQAHGLFGRWSPWFPLVVSTEWDVTGVSQPAQATTPAKNFLGLAGMLQADFEVIQGLHLSTTFEFLDATLTSSPPSYGIWGTVWWFLAPHIDVRGDVIDQSLPAAGSRTSATTLLAQIHAYL